MKHIICQYGEGSKVVEVLNPQQVLFYRVIKDVRRKVIKTDEGIRQTDEILEEPLVGWKWQVVGVSSNNREMILWTGTEKECRKIHEIIPVFLGRSGGEVLDLRMNLDKVNDFVYPPPR